MIVKSQIHKELPYRKGIGFITSKSKNNPWYNVIWIYTIKILINNYKNVNIEYACGQGLKVTRVNETLMYLVDGTVANLS